MDGWYLRRDNFCFMFFIVIWFGGWIREWGWRYSTYSYRGGLRLNFLCFEDLQQLMCVGDGWGRGRIGMLWLLRFHVDCVHDKLKRVRYFCTCRTRLKVVLSWKGSFTDYLQRQKKPPEEKVAQKVLEAKLEIIPKLSQFYNSLEVNWNCSKIYLIIRK